MGLDTSERISMHWEMRNVSKGYVEKLKERDYLKDLRVDDRIVLKQMLKKQAARVWTELPCLRIRFSCGPLRK
jgi:hypothetical protein